MHFEEGQGRAGMRAVFGDVRAKPTAWDRGGQPCVRHVGFGKHVRVERGLC